MGLLEMEGRFPFFCFFGPLLYGFIIIIPRVVVEGRFSLSYRLGQCILRCECIPYIWSKQLIQNMVSRSRLGV